MTKPKGKPPTELQPHRNQLQRWPNCLQEVASSILVSSTTEKYQKIFLTRAPVIPTKLMKEDAHG
jgi:hypothetical protein